MYSSSAGQLGHGDQLDYWRPKRVDALRAPNSAPRDAERGSGAPSPEPRRQRRVVSVSCGLQHTGAVIVDELVAP